jgi:hypothetical protein
MDREEVKYLLDYLEKNLKQLNSMEYEFLSSSKKLYNLTGVLTKRQIESLEEIKEHILSQVEDINESESDKYQAQYSSLDSSALTYVAGS